MTNVITQRLPKSFETVSPGALALTGIWILAMISLPIAKWTVGTSAIVWGVNLTTILQASAVITILVSALGLTRALRVVTTVVGLTWAVEAVGTTTGFPFGHYDYTDVLQPQLLDVPILIAFAWLMMLPSSWAVGYLINGRRYGLRFVLISAAAMTAWDFFLDPQMVGWNLWQWDLESGGYFGIPWVNFLGWFVTAALVTFVARPRDLPVMPLLTIYAIVWGLQTIGQAVFWGQPGPAAFGFVLMGTFLALAIRQLRREHA
jgi:lycopene beta-cyclase